MTEADARRQRRVAFHEAGHVVIAWHSGHQVGAVRITGDQGQADVLHPDGNPLFEMAVIALAGGASR